MTVSVMVTASGNDGKILVCSWEPTPSSEGLAVLGVTMLKCRLAMACGG